jgi:osmotically-inducible protein OsmY
MNALHQAGITRSGLAAGLLRATCLAAALTPAISSLQGCLPVVAAGAVGAGALMADDRRSSGTYLDDQSIEVKVGSRISSALPKDTHVNATSYNRVVLLTGEVPDEKARTEAARVARDVEGVRQVVNELFVADTTSLASRSVDTYITSAVKTRFIEARKFQANHVKVVTENRVVFLMGLVTSAEAADAAAIASRTTDVKKVVQVFEPYTLPKQEK